MHRESVTIGVGGGRIHHREQNGGMWGWEWGVTKEAPEG